MGKLNTTLKKKVNPEKSNKMIIAVGVGVAAIFIFLFILVMFSGKPANKLEAMNESLKYVKKSGGILSIKAYPEQNRAVIIYDGMKKDVDYITVARWASIRLSNELGDEEVTLDLCRNKEEDVVHSYKVRNGAMVREIAIKPVEYEDPSAPKK